MCLPFRIQPPNIIATQHLESEQNLSSEISNPKNPLPELPSGHISTPGKLPDSLTVEQLKSKHRSIPRNRLIADVFFMAGYIEAWGRGLISKIKQLREISINYRITGSYRQKTGGKDWYNGAWHEVRPPGFKKGR